MEREIDPVAQAVIIEEVRKLAEMLVGQRLLTEQEWRDMVLEEQAIQAHEEQKRMESDSLDRQVKEAF